MLSFNAGDGYSEAILRGYKMGLITNNQYLNLTQCDSIVELKNQLCSTDYYQVLHEESYGGKSMTSSFLSKKLVELFVKQFRYLKSVASPALSRFMDYITYGYMIDNVIILLAGALRSFDSFKGGEEDTDELLSRCHPLGMFETLPAIMIARSVDEIYNTVLVESPLASYFRGCFSADDLDEIHIELIRNHLWKAYLEDFHSYITTSGDINSETRALMTKILEFEADRRIINISINSCGNERLEKGERLRLFPRFGTLWDAGIAFRLAHVDDLDHVRILLDPFPEFRNLLNDFFNKSSAFSSGASSTTSYELPSSTGTNSTITNRNLSNNKNSMAAAVEPRTMEEHFFDYEVSLCKDAFEQQFTFTVFYAWTRLKEQEIRNIIWIAECIGQGQKQNIHNYIPLF